MKQFIFMVFFLTGTLVSICFAQRGAGLQNFGDAERLRTNKRYDAALQQYNKAVQLEPDVPDYWYGMGECWWAMKNPVKALEALKKANEVKKDFVKSYDLSGRILNAMKQFEKAGDQYALAFEYYQDPAKKIAAAIAGSIAYNRVKQYDKSLMLLSKAKQLQPDHQEINYFEAKTFNQQKQYQKTIDVLTAFMPVVAKMSQKDAAKFYYELGLAYHRLEDYPNAMEALKKADFGNFKPRVYELSAEYFFKAADAYAKVYEYQKANELLSQAIKIRPNYKEANDLLREINEPRTEVVKRIRAEMDSINKEKNPEKKSKMHCNLCRNQFKAGEYAAAAAAAEECLRTNPRNIPFIFYKSIAQYKSGNQSMAIFEMDKISKAPNLPADTKAMMFFALGLMYKEDKQPQVAVGFFRRLNGSAFAEAAKIELKALRRGNDASADDEEEDE
ncbi:tetratricopeptide repeat protein [Rhodoflexus sp.]